MSRDESSLSVFEGAKGGVRVKELLSQFIIMRIERSLRRKWIKTSSRKSKLNIIGIKCNLKCIDREKKKPIALVWH
jgi:hypothetical protein